MSRYVDADAFKKDVKHHLFVLAHAGSHAIGLDVLSHWFDNAPSIDIVFCRECKYWRNTDAEKIPTASIACGNMHADDFCSYGEREGE